MIRLVIGGARSGKSKFAENVFGECMDVVYIATARVSDREMEERIMHHKSSRPSVWRTFEGSYDLVEALGAEKNYLLDCITILTSNIMFDMTSDTEYINEELMGEVEEKVLSELDMLMDAVEINSYNLTFVTNEVGLSIVPEHHISRVFRDIQGRVNQMVAKRAHEVYMVCAGIPVRIK